MEQDHHAADYDQARLSVFFDNRCPLLTDTPQYFFVTDFGQTKKCLRPSSACSYIIIMSNSCVQI